MYGQLQSFQLDSFSRSSKDSTRKLYLYTRLNATLSIMEPNFFTNEIDAILVMGNILQQQPMVDLREENR
jgi:hypothetical protein